MITILLVASLLQLGLDKSASDTTYASTIGSRFYLNSTAKFDEFVLITIPDTASAIGVVRFLKASTATGSIKYQMMCNLLLRQITRDYSRERCLVLFSPRTRNLMLNQPYRVGLSSKLIYDVAEEKPEQDDYSSVRVLILPGDGEMPDVLVHSASGDLLPKRLVGAP